MKTITSSEKTVLHLEQKRKNMIQDVMTDTAEVLKNAQARYINYCEERFRKQS